MHTLAAAALALTLLAAPAAAQRAQVIDGDTIRVAGETIRMMGLDAPEKRAVALLKLASPPVPPPVCTTWCSPVYGWSAAAETAIGARLPSSATAPAVTLRR
jgi:endonuclease YncB( thermonuclease family)